MLVDLTGRIVLVPGGSGGIGSAVATSLSECGATVYLGYQSKPNVARQVVYTALAAGRSASAHHLDATDPASITAWVDKAFEMHGRIDVLASCVGIGGHFEPFKDEQPSKWQRVLDIELMSCLYLARAVVNGMVDQGYGRIVILSSDSGKVGEGTAAVSAAARGGVNAFIKSLAREISRSGVTVNAVCPGPTDTPLIRAMTEGEGGLGAKILPAMLRAIPMKRLGQPNEIAAMFSFLASDAASYVTGQAISVSGGLTMY